jgi:uncharacterized protein
MGIAVTDSRQDDLSPRTLGTVPAVPAAVRLIGRIIIDWFTKPAESVSSQTIAVLKTRPMPRRYLPPRFRTHLQWLLISFLMAGCVGKSVRTAFYVLNPDANRSESIRLPDYAGVIGVGPVSIPKYLDRPQVVTRVGRNKIRINDLHQWAGPLKHELMRVVQENLSRLFEGHDTVSYPWKNTDRVRYQIKISFQRLDVQDQTAVLWADWSLRDLQSADSNKTLRSRIETGILGNSYNDKVSGINDCLNHFSYEIAKGVANYIAHHEVSEPTGTVRPGGQPAAPRAGALGNP